MTTAFLTHPACLGHDTGPGHPECPARLQAVIDALAGPDFAALLREEAPLAPRAALARVHAPDYVAALLASVPQSGFEALDPDTVISPGSGEAALRAAGALLRGVDLVVTGAADNAFCAVRPPGHHAEPHRAMGFCLFNNVAVGALHARATYGLVRVAVVDFDVHHGNGTQAMFWDDADLFYASTHQWPLYPGTGRPDETGVPSNIVNVPLASGATGAEFRAAMAERVLPALATFAPEMVLISAGFDAHFADPLAGLRFDEGDFAWASAAICAVAAETAGGRVVSTLEGGYDLEALAASAAAHVGALMAA